VRWMQAGDILGVLRIEVENPSPWTETMLGGELEVEQGIRLVAGDESGRIAGWVACRLVEAEAELLKIAVAEAARRNGAGTLLLHRLCSALKEAGVKVLFLEVRSKNKTALQFYRKNGFIAAGRRRGYYTGPADDALLLRKELVQ
jgi:ribosomal-protein-alanine N-acetyltransferase